MKNGGWLDRYAAEGDEIEKKPKPLINLTDLTYTPAELQFLNDVNNGYCPTGNCLESSRKAYDMTAGRIKGIPGSNDIWTKDLNLISTPGTPSEKLVKDNPYLKGDVRSGSADSWDIHGAIVKSGGKNIYSGAAKQAIPTDIPTGAIAGWGPAGTRETSNKQRSQGMNTQYGLQPSHHSTEAVGYDDSGKPIFYDSYTRKYGTLDEISKELKDKLGYELENISVPKSVATNTKENLNKKGILKTELTPFSANIDKLLAATKQSWAQINEDGKSRSPKADKEKLSKFAQALSDNKGELVSNLGLSDSDYNRLANSALAIAMAESEGGGALGFADNFGSTQGMTQLNFNNVTKDKRLKTALSKKYKGNGNLRNIQDPYNSAIATMMYLSVADKDAKRLYDKGLKPGVKTINQPGFIENFRSTNSKLNKDGLFIDELNKRIPYSQIPGYEDGDTTKVNNYLKQLTKSDRYSFVNKDGELSLKLKTKGNNPELTDVEKIAYMWQSPNSLKTGDAEGKSQYVNKIKNYYDALTKFNDGGPIQPNYNDASTTTGPDYVGTGYDITGRNYSPAWGGQFQLGGSLPGSVGFTYARTKNIPSNGPYAKKTKASAQNGKEMSFYQNGLDWDAKTISQDGTAVKKQPRDMRTLAERKADEAKALDAKLRAQQPSLQKASSPINDERRRQLNEQYAQQSGKRYNPTTGSIEDRFNPQQDRMLNRAYENIVEPMIDAEMIASAAAPLVGKGVKALAKGLKNAGKEYLENKAAKNLSNELPSLPKEFYYDVNSPSGGLQQSDITDKLIKDYTHHLDEEEKLIFDLNLPEETYNSINFDEVQDIIKNKSQIVTPNKKPINYSEPLTDDQYGKWREEIYKGLSNYISPEELKELHKQSINHFKNSTVTGSGGKEHGLFIRNLIHDKIPQFNNPIIRNAKGQQIEFQPYDKLNEFPSTKGEDILNLINNSGYDVSKLSSEDWNIIDAYTHGYDNSINGALRENRTSLGTTGNFYKDQGNKLLESILKNKADKPFQVMRGVRNYDVELLHPETHLPLGIKKSRSNLSTGDIFKDDSFLSTSIPKDYSSFGENISSELIDVPGGNIQSIAIPEASSYPQYSGEKEIILPKGLIRKVEETYPIDEVYKPYRFRTSILNPYTITGAIGGAAALQQKKQGGKITKDDNGYWNPKNWGKPVEIGSNNITMQGVHQPLIGISDEGDVQYMHPGEHYKFKGKKVVEYPVKKNGGWLEKYN